MAWPSSFSAGTLGYMKDRIADEIARADLTTQIAVAIADAITIYQKERFRFSESRDNVFNTVAGQEFYTLAANPAIGNLLYIDYLNILISNVQESLRRMQPEELELASQAGTQMGQPYEYSYYNETIRLYPTPDNVYQIRISAHVLVAAPATDTEANNRWMTDAERLIRARAKYELAINVTKDADEIQINSPFAPDGGQPMGQAWAAYRDLHGEANRLTARGVITAMQF